MSAPAPPGELALDVLDLLKADSPRSQAELCEVTGRTIRGIGGSLGSLRRRGLIRLVHSPDHPTRYEPTELGRMTTR